MSSKKSHLHSFHRLFLQSLKLLAVPERPKDILIHERVCAIQLAQPQVPKEKGYLRFGM